MPNEQPDSVPGDLEDRRAIIVCPGCAHENREGPHFCAKCGAPLTAFATVGPFESIFAQGQMYRRATGGPTRGIVVVGMWLVCLPQLAVLAVSLREPRAFMAALGVSMVWFVLLQRVTINYLRQRRAMRGHDEPPEDPREDI